MSLLTAIRSLEWFDDVELVLRDGPRLCGTVWKCQHRAGSTTSENPGSVFVELQIARADVDVEPLASSRCFVRGSYRRPARLDLTAYVRRVAPDEEPGVRAPRHDLGTVQSVEVVGA